MNTVTESEIKKKERESSSSSSDENFLSLKKGNTYLVRLLPNRANPATTFADYEEYGFTSVTGSGYIYAGRTPSSMGRKDMVKDLQWATYSKGKEANDEALMKRSYTLFPQKKEMVNVYVIDDPTNPDNNGTVKVLRYSSKVNKDGVPTSPLYAKIQDSIFGDEKGDIGKKAFDLTGNGVNFAIKVEENQGGWNDYSKSNFKFPNDIGLSEAEISEIYESTLDLETFIPEALSDEKLKALLDQHWYGNASASVNEEVELSDDTDDIPMDFADPDAKVEELSDDMDDFLGELDDLDSK
jgi:hypothetical protein|tara:strand:+ start:47798 stop:48688 length:891 start_codon:yes stop_codon:yes gene_type:complete